MQTTPQDLYRLFAEECKTFSEIAVLIGRSRSYVKKTIEDYRTSEHIDQEARDRERFDVIHLGTPLTLKGDFLVAGDIHVPTTDYEFASRIPQIAAKHLKNPRLIIAGDFFNLDAFSSYAAVCHAPTWKEERDAGRVLIRQWLDVFESIFIIMGNHDRRLQKWAGGELDETDIFGMLIQSPRVQVSNYGWLTVETERGPWRVTHSRNYSVNQLTVASDLANKFQCHILSHHEHHLAKGMDKWGRYVIVNNGTLADAKKIAYATLDDTKMPAMIQGFTLLKNGTPYLFGNAPFTDWDYWLK